MTLLGLSLLKFRQKNAPDSVRGEKIPRYHPDLPSEESISRHPVTGMNRPAHRGPLESGCFLAWAEGLHLTPLAESRFQEAGFVIAFIFFILYSILQICQGADFLSLLLHLYPGKYPAI